MGLKARVRFDGLASPVKYGDIEIPGRYWFEISPDDEDERPELVITVVITDGTPRVQEVRMTATEHGRGVQRSDLILPIEDHLEFATKWVAALHEPQFKGQAVIDLDELQPAFMRDFRRARRSDLRRGPTDDDLRKAAEVYTTAESAPVKAVKKHFGLADRTASLWVKRARDKGFM